MSEDVLDNRIDKHIVAITNEIKISLKFISSSGFDLWCCLSIISSLPFLGFLRVLFWQAGEKAENLKP
jgi:hypothetical protein